MNGHSSVECIKRSRMKSFTIPADVPPSKKELFARNMQILCKKTEHLFMFACDQKIEHLHDDFSPNDDDIPHEAIDAEHFFKIASQGTIGALATQLELIARYAPQYPTIPYIAKLNSKTNLIPTTQKEPMSTPLWSVKDAVQLIEEHAIPICGIGITIYLGSEFEDKMMHFAAKSIFEAHKNGLLAIVWMYPRGKAISDDSDAHLLAGAAGAANALGADIDLAVDAGKKVGIDTILNIKATIEETTIPLFVDVVDIHAVADDFKQEILKDALLWTD